MVLAELVQLELQTHQHHTPRVVSSWRCVDVQLVEVVQKHWVVLIGLAASSACLDPHKSTAARCSSAGLGVGWRWRDGRGVEQAMEELEQLLRLLHP